MKYICMINHKPEEVKSPVPAKSLRLSYADAFSKRSGAPRIFCLV